jgi:hypothetical protein
MCSWASPWQRATQLEQEFKNDDRREDDWHMAYVRVTTNIAQWIQANTGANPAAKAWACAWLSNNPPAIEALKTALSIDGLQGETKRQSQPLGTDLRSHPPQIILSADTNAFVRDYMQAFAALDYNSEIWMSLLRATVNDEQRGFTML